MYKDYEILQLKPGSSLDSIKKSYRKLVKKWHPDLYPASQKQAQEKAHRMFLQISESYTRLIKHHSEAQRSSYGGSGKGSSPYDYYPQDIYEEDRQPTQTIEMVDKKWPDGTRYEGMALNGQFHGRGIYTYPNGDVYTGEFRFGKMQGQGQFKFINGNKYIGSVEENQMHGSGKMLFVNGDRYMGHFAHNQYHGEGILATQQGVQAGQWDQGRFMG
ncbi:MAG: DnaJ domain-containing protein [Candidatus Nitrohelix vancouverensis]|uniref:DnaJ domain-containing protein n=1 Tax=Candidatus Nitrohelix vancouverensis TaxID=2705534 RepID=A0A7T0G444_9BACT|nr:MAG: DnaJ domain-containing protein [Candidatus Nitrohelix vancouverensis]